MKSQYRLRQKKKRKEKKREGQEGFHLEQDNEQ